MPGYPKIWTSILDEDWFIPLSLNARGVYLQLLLEAKKQGDTGRVSFRSVREMAQRWGGDRSTVANCVSKFQQLGKIEVVEKSTRLITLEILQYRKYQGIKRYKDKDKSEEGGLGVAENSTSIEEEPTEVRIRKEAPAPKTPLFENQSGGKLDKNRDKHKISILLTIAKNDINKRFDILLSENDLKKIMFGFDGYDGFKFLGRLSIALKRIKGKPDDPVAMLINFARQPEKYLNGDREYDEWKAIR